MKISVIWKLSEQEKENNKTLECLLKESEQVRKDIQILLYGSEKETTSWNEKIVASFGEVVVCSCDDWSDVEMYQHAATLVNGECVTQLNGGDTWTIGAFEKVRTAFSGNVVLDGVAVSSKDYKILMLNKIMPDETKGAFCAFNVVNSNMEYMGKDLQSDSSCYPFYFGGTFVKAELFKKYPFKPELGIEAEREFFLSICAKEKKVIFLPNTTYYSFESREGDITFYKAVYEREWYIESFTEFWLPYLEQMKENYGEVPNFVQHNLMFSIISKIKSNLDNKNKHVVEYEDAYKCLDLMGQALQYVNDDIMYNIHKLPSCEIADAFKWIFGVLKYDTDYQMDKYYMAGNAYFGGGSRVLGKISDLKTNILFMDYKDGCLEIDGNVNPVLYAMADEVYFVLDNKKYSLKYNGRYTLTKVFGVSVYKSMPFHVSLPMDKIKDSFLYCYAKVGGETIKIFFTYQSHFSRMSGRFKNSYWCFGNDPIYLSKKEDGGIRFRIVDKKEKVKQELRLMKEMFLSFKKRAWLFLIIRLVYFVTRPIMKRKPIWMYIDKIYKGGDSSEYLYRYASKQDNNFRHYYLVDKKATDYKRLKKDGFKPLVRGSIKHRLAFLMADMMVISNSTVFAFNNYGMENSSYIRDLVNFHVCCVQHGMSVQKIAIAQNRLRDNTRLYFCASEYEIENLSRPVYDYVGYDALKLTGVPRYDGLINNDKKQIMISPTWRMQAAVPVRTNEGEQRDYNPLFKESTYFKVFNSLINDERLIEAAKKYGYRIKYVLHPIVSAQVNDFDKNEYVDVIPAVGDMSYEKMFCESSLMVTDFSGIQFDFAYMRKPLVYLHHKDIPQHYEEGSFFYDTMGFGEICRDNDELIDLLCEYMANGCQMKEEYVRRADDFFYYDDHNNCERIYNTMIEYQEKNILRKN